MKIGKFYISFEMINNGKIASVLAKMEFIPTRVENIYHRQVFEYIGISSLFRDKGKGEMVPEYTVTINNSLGEFFVEVNEVKETTGYTLFLDTVIFETLEEFNTEKEKAMSKEIDNMDKLEYIKHLNRAVKEGCYKGKDLLESIGMPLKSIGEVLNISHEMEELIFYRLECFEKEEKEFREKEKSDDSISYNKRLKKFKDKLWESVIDIFKGKIKCLVEFLFVEKGRKTYFIDGTVNKVRESFFKYDRVDLDSDPK